MLVRSQKSRSRYSLGEHPNNFLNSRLNDCCESKCKDSAISSIDLAVSLTRMAARQSLRLRMYDPRGMCMKFLNRS